MKEIVIVGAGPVGLWTAIQLKKRNPENCITMANRKIVWKVKNSID